MIEQGEVRLRSRTLDLWAHIFHYCITSFLISKDGRTGTEMLARGLEISHNEYTHMSAGHVDMVAMHGREKSVIPVIGLH
jgi:hypothetical protein